MSVQLGPRASGSALGFAGAAVYAPDATTVTMRWLGFVVDDLKYEASVNALVNAFWGGVLVILGLFLGYLYLKAQARWGGDNTGQETGPSGQPIIPAGTPTVTTEAVEAEPGNPAEVMVTSDRPEQAEAKA